MGGVVKNKFYAEKLETIDTLKDNIHEAIGDIQLNIIDNLLKNWSDFLFYGRIVLSNNKKGIFAKYSVVFF